MSDITAYPLCWPHGQARTPQNRQKRAPFNIGADKALNELVREIKMLGGRDVIISSNVPVRKDGLPYADAARRIISDPGVAVYFSYKGAPRCFACDKWDMPKDNVRAIGKTIEALRGIARWGSGDMMDRAFSGYTALPAPGPRRRAWYQVLGVLPSAPFDEIKAAYRDRARTFHPDNGGSHEQMAEINAAFDEACLERGKI